VGQGLEELRPERELLELDPDEEDQVLVGEEQGCSRVFTCKSENTTARARITGSHCCTSPRKERASCLLSPYSLFMGYTLYIQIYSYYNYFI